MVLVLPAVTPSLTSFSDAKDFTEDESELDAASGKWTLVFVFSTAVFQDKLGKQLNKERPGNTELPLLQAQQRSQAHPTVGIRIASGKIIHGVQSEKARRGSHQILPRVTVVLKGHDHWDAKHVQMYRMHTRRRPQTLTEKPNFLNSLAQRDRRLSLLRLLSLSDSNASWRKQ